jgi:phosphatidylinositol 4-kinase
MDWCEPANTHHRILADANGSPPSLEFDLQRLILSDLAKSISSSLENDRTPTSELQNAIDAVESRVQVRDVSRESDAKEGDEGMSEAPEPRVFMVRSPDLSNDTPINETRHIKSASRTQCNIAFGELTPSMPESHVENSVSVLTDILRDVPFIDFEHSLSWTGANFCNV